MRTYPLARQLTVLLRRFLPVGLLIALALALPLSAYATGTDAMDADVEETTLSEQPVGTDEQPPVDGTEVPAPDMVATSGAEAAPGAAAEPEGTPRADEAADGEDAPLGAAAGGATAEGQDGVPAGEGDPEADDDPAPNPEPKPQLVADGVYLIRSDLGARYVLSATGATAAPKANALLAAYTGAAKQAWHLTFDAERGRYQIWRSTTDGTRAVLEVQSAGTAEGTNVRLWYDNHSMAQYWDIEPSGAGYRIVSALQPNYVLEIGATQASDGANAQMALATGAKAQRFYFHTTKPAIPSGTKTVEEGSYQIACTIAGGEANVADIAGGSTANDANLRMWSNNRSTAQRFYLSYHEGGYYTIASVKSERVLDAAAGGLLPHTNVQQHTDNGSAAQQWVVVANANGTYSFHNRRSGLALDVSGGSAAKGANLHLYTANGSPAQQFRLVPVDMLDEGLYTISPRSAQGMVLDIKGGSAASGAGVQLWSANDSLAQKFQLVRVAGNEYRIRTGASGGWLEATSLGAQVVQRGNHATSASAQNTWRATMVGGRVVLVNKATGGALALAGGSTAKGTKVVTTAPSGAALQQFVLATTDLVRAGCYFVRNGKGPYLDVAGDATAAGANLQVWKQDKSGGQYFYLEKSGSAWRIKNANSNKYLTAAGTGNRANVAQQASSGSNSQKWRAAIADGGRVSFVGVASGRALDVAGGSTANGANVQIYNVNHSAAQSWQLVKTTYQPYSGYMLRAVKAANASRSSTSYLIVVDKSNHKVIVMKGGNGNWKPHRTMTCTVGAKSTPTVEGSFTVGSRGYSFGSGYTCYYWTQFYNDYLFHSVLYKEGTRTIQDGRLGYHLSHGCVRMDINDAYWIYTNIPSGTRVLVYS